MEPIPYTIAPMVNTIPPLSNSIKPLKGSTAFNELNDIKIIHPIIKYSSKDGILNFSKLIEFSSTPIRAHPHIIPNNVHPTAPPIKLIQNGV